ncbi:alpha/beta hydrolase family protein [Microbacterium sp. ASV49]|uniref:Alpha/beta fold hydrolase n=1 Tax=Microbacterium candidum TaxID=3041922 RepID=A0ABT7MW07_9MICO|nr:alpha/beta fold hydrolase [Microbacterium sp. ASV49]MDL9978629.1 alpha/beta fold hydrolase [Microbacterium sp. ASV49]
MRWVVAAAVAVGAAAAAAGAIGFMIARRLTAPVGERVFDLMVRDVVRRGDQDAVVLDRTARTAAPGLYNLWLDNGGWVKLGAVLDGDAVTVTREITSVAPDGALRTGQHASWSGIYYRDPADAGLDAADATVETDVGPAPAWLIRPADGEGDAWAIHIHGLGSPRAGALRGVRVASDLGFTSLVVSYRNDGEGPTVGSGRSTLGATETEDVAAALRYAIAQGAQRIVLFGWSMGAAIALQLAADPEFADTIYALVLESPVLDWGATIAANCARAGLPSWFGPLGGPWLERPTLVRLVGLHVAVHLAPFNWLDRACDLSIPTLILHGTRDRSSPIAASARVAALRPDLIRLETFAADHTMTWNSDPERFGHVVEEWRDRRVR